MGAREILQEDISARDLHICERCAGCDRHYKFEEQIARVGTIYLLKKECGDFREESID